MAPLDLEQILLLYFFDSFIDLFWWAKIRENCNEFSEELMYQDPSSWFGWYIASIYYITTTNIENDDNDLSQAPILINSFKPNIILFPIIKGFF